jgi:hypothetical protein
MQIIDAVQKSADRYDNPDDRYGHGIPNFRIAYNYLESLRQQKTDTILKGKWIMAYPVPFRRIFTVFVKAPSAGRASIKIFDIGGRLLSEKNVDVLQGNYYKVPMNVSEAKRFGLYFLQYFDGKNRSTVRLLSL